MGLFEKLLTLKEAAALLRIHPKTLQNMALGREVPALKIRQGWRFRESDLLRWINSLVRLPEAASKPAAARGTHLPKPIARTVDSLRRIRHGQ